MAAGTPPPPDSADGAGIGVEIVRAALATLPEAPGVYRMLDARGEALYVGKARSLKKRVASYARPERLPLRLQRMVAATASMAFVRTHTEAEALLLESNLIKKLKPRFNILMRDDKSFPYILIAEDHDFPRLTKHRGAREIPGQYFGPFASGLDVNRTLVALQRAFMLRNCSNAAFAGRTRPCLEYHIKRCTAPCVGFVSREDYAAQVEDARKFLSGKSRQVQDDLAARMREASDAQDFEKAALYRDRIKALTAVQARQIVNVEGLGDVDLFALTQSEGRSCVQVFFFRAGQNLGNRGYFPRHDPEESPEAILAAFLAQFYENKPIPAEIILSHEPMEKALLEEALGTRGGCKAKLLIPRRGMRRELVDFALGNARDALAREIGARAKDAALLEGVAKLFDLEKPPQRIEIYDNSHVSGVDMIGAMVVAGPEGWVKNAYRKFNIKDAPRGDDYAMMREVFSRRFGKAEDGAEAILPDLVLVDGGAGQLSAALEALRALGLDGKFALAGVAKGPDRNAGREKFFQEGAEPFQLPERDPVLHYIQRLRDEAHRFAIGAHRARRGRKVARSLLDDVPGIGAHRKKALLTHFGSAGAVARAGLKDLQAVEGISDKIARKIYAHFNET